MTPPHAFRAANATLTFCIAYDP